MRARIPLTVTGLKAISGINPNMKGLPESKLFRDYNPGILVQRHLNTVAAYLKPMPRLAKAKKGMTRHRTSKLHKMKWK